MLKVLLVSDDVQEEALLSFELQRAGMAVSTASSVDEALALCGRASQQT